MRLVILGDSHCHALGGALAPLKESEPELFGDLEVEVQFLGGSWHSYGPFFDTVQEGLAFTAPFFRECYERYASDGILRPDPGAVYAIVLGFHAGRVLASETWKDHAPWQMDERCSPAGPLSDQVVEEIVRADARFAVEFYEALGRFGFAFVAVEAPPQRRDHRAIRERNTPPVTFLEIDRIHRAFFKAQLEAMSVTVVEAPEESYGEDGFLRSDLRSTREDDFVHANAEYGLMMLPRVIAAVSRLRDHGAVDAVGSTRAG